MPAPKKKQRNSDRDIQTLTTTAQEISPSTIADLRPSGYNPRSISAEQQKMLKDSLKEYGDLSGIIFNKRTGRLIGGHQRTKLFDPAWPITKEEATDATGTVAYGYIETPEGRMTYREVDWPETKEKAANVAANKLGGTFDDDLLHQLFQDLNNNGFDLSGLLEADELKEFLTSLEDKQLGDEDKIVEPVPEPFVKLGDLWVCGESRLLVGDSTSIADIDKLMMGEKADLVVTDPPYGIAYESKAGKIENDDLNPEALEKFLTAAFSVMSHALKSGGCWYVYHADGGPLGAAFRNAINADKNLLLKQTIIWVKSSATLCRSDYNMQHEPCLYGWKAGAAHYYDGDFTRTSVVDDDIDVSKMDKKALVTLVNSLRTKVPSTIIRVDKPAKSEIHPTMKPVRLFERNIWASSKPGEIVLDLFNGSGTAIIACRKNGRRGRGMELSPQYAQATLKRYMDYCGEEPQLMDDKGKLTPFSKVEKDRSKKK